MNLGGLRDKDGSWNEIKMWNFNGMSRKNKCFEKKQQKILTPKFSCPKSWKTWKTRLFGTWKSVSDDFDDLWTCMNLGGLRDKECS